MTLLDKVLLTLLFFLQPLLHFVEYNVNVTAKRGVVHEKCSFLCGFATRRY